MKIRLITIICSLLVVGYMSSCIEQVDSGLLNAQGGKLAVSSLISPQSPFIEVEIYRTKSSLDEDEYTHDEVEDAQVLIIHGNDEMIVPFDASLRKYVLSSEDFPIEEGETYHLKVNHGSDEVKAHCTVPTHYVDNVDFDLVDRGEEVGIFLNWTAGPNSVNYYRIDFEMSFEDIYGGWEIYGSNVFKSGGEGQEIFGSDSYYLYDEDLNDLTINYDIFTYDENAYLYQKNVDIPYYEDPFSEPVIYHSNIEGGIGIFGAYLIRENLQQTVNL